MDRKIISLHIPEVKDIISSVRANASILKIYIVIMSVAGTANSSLNIKRKNVSYHMVERPNSYEALDYIDLSSKNAGEENIRPGTAPESGIIERMRVLQSISVTY